MMKAAKIVAVTALLLLPAVSLAATFRGATEVSLAKGQTHEGSFYAAGNSITIDGNVHGDVFCAGQNLTVNGTVDGDVICAGQSITINGTVTGNLRLAGQSINVNGQVARNATLVGQSLVLHGSIGGEAMAAGQSVSVSGPIGTDLYGGGGQVDISGQIGRNVDYQAEDLHIQDGATIGGNLDYTSRKDASIAPGAKIAGSTQRHEPPAEKNQPSRAKAGYNVAAVLMSIIWTLVLALILSWLARPFIENTSALMRDKSAESVGWGLLALIGGPIALVLLLITVIGAPLAAILGMLWVVALIISRVLVAFVVGYWLLNRFTDNKPTLLLGGLVGVIGLWIVFSIPVIGWVLSLAALVWGLGGIMMYAGELITKGRHEKRQPGRTVAA